MKVKVCRQSGLPVELKALDEYKAEFKENFDKLYDEFKGDMEVLNTRLSELDDRMAEKYDTIIEWDYLSDYENTLKQLTEYGPIMFSKHAETGELVYIILDQGI